MGLLKEFKEFASKGNVMDLAVGIIIGGAFGKIVTSFVADIIMPLINPLIPGGDWRSIEVGKGIKLGNFMGTVVDFLIVAFAVFMLIKAMNRLKQMNEQKAETVETSAPEAMTKEEQLLAEIRDLLKQQNAQK